MLVGVALVCVVRRRVVSSPFIEYEEIELARARVIMLILGSEVGGVSMVREQEQERRKLASCHQTTTTKQQKMR